MPTPKIVPPITSQLPNESQRFWQQVTTNIKEKRFQEATKQKTELEERQREKAKDREKQGNEWHPRFFKEGSKDGRPELSEDGVKALEGLQAGIWELKESEVTGA